MAKNLIPQIVQILGVEIGEEFKIKGREYTFHFVDDGLIAYRADGSVLPYENCLAHFLWLINGEEEIVKLPWKPKFADRYFGFFKFNEKLQITRYDIWRGTVEEEAQYRCGWIFRTREEAEAALPAVATAIGVEYKL